MISGKQTSDCIAMRIILRISLLESLNSTNHNQYQSHSLCPCQCHIHLVDMEDQSQGRSHKHSQWGMLIRWSMFQLRYQYSLGTNLLNLGSQLNNQLVLHQGSTLLDSCLLMEVASQGMEPRSQILLLFQHSQHQLSPHLEHLYQQHNQHQRRKMKMILMS